MTPAESRRRRDRRRRRDGGAVRCTCAAFAVVVAGGAGQRSRASRRHAPRGTDVAQASRAQRTRRPGALRRPACRSASPRSRCGDRLPAEDPVQIALPHPPRAGLLFNLEHRPGPVAAQPLQAPAHRQPDEDDDRAADGRVRAAGRARAGHQSQAVDSNGSKVGVLPLGRRVRARDDALRPAAALGQRRRGRARAARRRQRRGVRRAHERRGGESWGWAARATPRRRATSTRATTPAPPTSRCSPTSTSTAAHRAHRAHLQRRSCRSRSRAASSTSTTTTRC